MNPKTPRPSVPVAERLRAWFRSSQPFILENYGLDTRALGIFRICLAAMLLYDLASRATYMTAHYTDDGFMPRDKLLGGWSNPLFYSFHNWGGDLTSQTLIFCVAGVFALMLLVGFKTRLATILSYILLTSVQGRNYLILQGGDDILRVMVFWSMFAPLAARFSVDAVLRARHPEASPVPLRVVSVGTLALASQLLVMYLVSGILKSGPAWHQNGNAISLAIHHHTFATPFGIFVRENVPESVLKVMTHSVLGLELFGPFLFFIPIRTYLFRTLQAFLFIGFHFGLFLTMNLGHFPWVCMLAWLMVLPSWFWDVPVARLITALKLGPRLESVSRSVADRIRSLAPRLRPGIAPPPPVFAPTRWAIAFTVALVAYIGAGTAYAANHSGNVEGKAFEPLLMLRMSANWGMFAPNPPSESGWFVFVAKQKGGNQIDPWRYGTPVTFEQPELPTTTYRVERWRKFLDNIMNPRHAVVRPYFLKWLCNDWNEDHAGNEQITEIEFFHMVQNVRWPDKGYGPLRKVALGKQRCPAQKAAKAF